MSDQKSSRISNQLVDLYNDFIKDADKSINLGSPEIPLYQKQEIPLNESPDISPSKKNFTQLNQSDGRVVVRITSSNVGNLLPSLQNLGFEVTGSAPDFNLIEGWMPIASIPQLDSLGSEGLMGVIPVYTPINSAGSVNSQADFVQEANRVRTSQPTGFDGTGVRVGVISDSYNISGNGSAAADIASGDLPTGGVTVLKEGSSGDADEGRAMLQLVHDLAPGSSLAFASANGGETSFAQQIRNLADPSQGNAQILVDDVFYLSEPFFQDGIVAQAVDDVVTNRGVTYFSSAGNQARQAYESTNFAGASDSFATGKLFHDFDPGTGVDTRQRITLGAGQTIELALQWDDPFYTTNGVKTDLDIFLLRGGTNTVLARSDADSIANQTPFEYLTYTNPSSTASQAVDVLIEDYAGPTPGRIKYVNFGDNVTTNEFATNSPTTFGHSAAVNAESVAAVNYFNQQNPASFTSAGPVTILFNSDGTRKAAQEVRQKPDFAAIQGTDTTFFGSDYDGNGFPNFFGTSAAAPHAAATAALVKQANPSLTPAQIYNKLESTATDIGTPGTDDLTGVGLINAYDAVFGSVVPASLNFSDNFEDGSLPIAFETKTNGAGRIQVTNANAPLGTRHLTLDSSLGGTNSLNEAILHVNSTNFTNVQLSFAQKEFSDEDNTMPSTFTGSNNSDGVALSVDGINWFSLISLTGTNSTNIYQTNTFDLSAFAASKGITLGSDVRIKFQQYDNYPIGDANSDGFAFDNISVTGAAVINGTSGRGTLIGTAGNDVITGFQGQQIITTGGGNDQIVYTSIRDAGDRITDFTVGSDKIVLTTLLDSIVPGGYNGTNAITDGYVSFGSLGNDTVVLIDTDSSGSRPAKPYLTVESVPLAALNNANNFIF